MMRRILITILFLLLATAASRAGQPALHPLPEETVNTLQQGLLPRYFAKFFARDVRQLPEDTGSELRTWVGKPIDVLNHQFGDGEVFASGLNRGVGVRLRGAIHFPTSGAYTFQALSNDGIEMFLGEALVVSDPKQHADQLSEEASVQIPAAGWYPVRIDYFQRKGTATLQLFWKTPTNGKMTVVPPEAYGHPSQAYQPTVSMRKRPARSSDQ